MNSSGGPKGKRETVRVGGGDGLGGKRGRHLSTLEKKKKKKVTASGFQLKSRRKGGVNLQKLGWGTGAGLSTNRYRRGASSN